MVGSDASSEMSDDALHELVSRLVDAGGDLEGDDANTLGDGQTKSHLAPGAPPEGACNDSASTCGEGDTQLLGAGNQLIWPTSSMDQPSPIQARWRSPRSDGLEPEAALLSSADVSEVSSEARQLEPAVAIGISTVREAEADSCGYEGDVGESANLAHPLRRSASVIKVVPPCIATKDGAEEADDEGSGKEASKSHVQQHPTSLDVSAGRGCAYFARTTSLGQITGEVEENTWESLNKALREQAFRQISLSRPGGSIVVPDLVGLTDTLRDVLFQHRERGKIIQELSLELSKHNQVSGHRDQILNASFRRQRTDLCRRSAGAEARVNELEEERERLQEQLARETRRLKTENANLASQLRQSEHRVKAKEVAAQGLMDKLRDEVERERLTQQRQREMLKNSQQREGRGGGLDDSRASEALSAQGKAKERAEAEMDSLRAEVGRLGDELREKENTILRHRLGPDWTPNLEDSHRPGELQRLRDRMAESERSVRVWRQREERAQERCASMQQEIDDVQAKMKDTQESLANAQMELSSRPSLRSWRTSQRRILHLEKKLTQANTQAKEAVDVVELRRWVDTRELMRRDRENHRLKLDRLNDLPSTVMKQVLQCACRLLALEDVSLLGPAIEKLIKAVQVLPRLERFVNSVCAFVFRHSMEVLSAPADCSLTRAPNGRMRTMEDVLPLLEVWLARAQEPAKLKEFHRGVVRVLKTRAGRPEPKGTGDPSKNDYAVISAIRHLVQLERKSLEEAQCIQQADCTLNDDPELPANRVVRHFQLLFGVKSIVGCTAKLNEVYRFSSETQTFLRTAGDLMDMPNATAETVMKRIEAVLQRRRDVNPEACLRVSHEAGSWTAAQSTSHRSLET